MYNPHTTSTAIRCVRNSDNTKAVYQTCQLFTEMDQNTIASCCCYNKQWLTVSIRIEHTRHPLYTVIIGAVTELVVELYTPSSVCVCVCSLSEI